MPRQFSVEVPINPDGMIELFYKSDFERYDADDFKIEHFSEEESCLLQDFLNRIESQIPVLPLSRTEGSWFIHAENVKEALPICDDILKSCSEPEAAAVRKMRTVLLFAEKEFKPIHFFTEEAMRAMVSRDSGRPLVGRKRK